MWSDSSRTRCGTARAGKAPGSYLQIREDVIAFRSPLEPGLGPHHSLWECGYSSPVAKLPTQTLCSRLPPAQQRSPVHGSLLAMDSAPASPLRNPETRRANVQHSVLSPRTRMPSPSWCAVPPVHVGRISCAVAASFTLSGSMSRTETCLPALRLPPPALPKSSSEPAMQLGRRGYKCQR